MLKSIQINGFKSFAKKGNLSFQSAITAIVGPNGSGKSNTAEAFRFVLGEQGGKSMRVKKGTDLIWGGSHTLPKGSRAGVKVVLDNSAGTLNIDFDEVIIERSVLRDGTNEYSINGAKVRLKDVHDVLAGANIGSSGHHIISQGEADRVLGASPKERKEMLEDALGLKVYQLKKGEALRKLTTTGHNLEKTESRRRELLPHLTFLARQVARIEQSKKLKEQLKAQAGAYFAHEQEWITQESDSLQSALPQPSRELEEVEARVQGLRELIEQSKAKNTQEEEHNPHAAEMEAERSKIISLRSTLASLRTELGRAAGQLEMLKVVAQKAKDVPSAISRKVVKELIGSVMHHIDSGNIAKAKAMLEHFMHKEIEAKPRDNGSDVQGDDALSQERASLLKAQKELNEQVAGQEQAIAKQEQLIAHMQMQAQQAVQQETEHERDLYKATAQYNELRATLAELGRRQENVMARKLSLSDTIGEVQVLIGETIKRSDIQREVQPHGDQQTPTYRDIERLKIQLEQQGTLSTEVIDEHKEAQEHHDFLNKEITDMQEAASKLTELIAQLDERMQAKFSKGLTLINREFNSFFSTLFDGGNAQLELVELNTAKTEADEAVDGAEHKEVQYGVSVHVNLPRKKVTTLETLSGGERALASIALIFAMSQVNPPPFIILDETDAALDEANSQRYANIVKKLSERSQIILITHNRATMAAADTLYGVTMGGDGVSQLLSVQLTEAEEFAK